MSVAATSSSASVCLGKNEKESKAGLDVKVTKHHEAVSAKERKVEKADGCAKTSRAATGVVAKPKELSQAYENLRHYLFDIGNVKISKLKQMIQALEEGEINAQKNYGGGSQTLLNIAIAAAIDGFLRHFNGQFEEILEALLKNGADPCICNKDLMNDGGNAPLHVVIDRYKTIHRFNSDSEGKIRGALNTPFSHAHKQRVIRVLELLKKYGADVNQVNLLGLTPLQMLCHNETHSYPQSTKIPRKTLPEIAAKLVEMGARTDSPGQYGTPLHMLVKGCLDFPIKHLDRKFKLTEYMASIHDVNQAVEVEPNRRLSARLSIGDTPLHALVETLSACSTLAHGWVKVEASELDYIRKVTDLLLEKGANVNATNSLGHSPFSLLTLEVKRIENRDRPTDAQKLVKETYARFVSRSAKLSDANKWALAKEIVLLDTRSVSDETLKEYPIRECFLKGELFRCEHWEAAPMMKRLFKAGFFAKEEALDTALKYFHLSLCHLIFGYFDTEVLKSRIVETRNLETKTEGEDKARERYGQRMRILTHVYPHYLENV